MTLNQFGVTAEANDRLLECLRSLSGWKPQAYRGMRNAFEILGDVTAIKMHYKNEIVETVIDTDDLPKVLRVAVMWVPCYHWQSGTFRAVQGRVNRKPVVLSRIIMGRDTELLVDHINHDPLDNRRENLRFVDRAGNAQNLGRLPAHNTSGFRGVSYDKQRKLWAANVHMGSRHVYLGRFATAEEAGLRAAEYRRDNMPCSPEAAAILAAVDAGKAKE